MKQIITKEYLNSLFDHKHTVSITIRDTSTKSKIKRTLMLVPWNKNDIWIYNNISDKNGTFHLKERIYLKDKNANELLSKYILFDN